MREIALFTGKIYTAGTNFTRPPVVTVATNLNSAEKVAPMVLDGQSSEETSFAQDYNRDGEIMQWEAFT